MKIIKDPRFDWPTCPRKKENRIRFFDLVMKIIKYPGFNCPTCPRYGCLDEEA